MTDEKQLQMVVKLNQVEDGRKYEGELIFSLNENDGRKLTYDMEFTVPIPKLDDEPMSTEPDDIRRNIPINMKREDGTEIQLTNEEYGWFFQTLAVMAVDFYNNPQTRDSNAGIMGQVIRGEGPFGDVMGGVKGQIGMETSMTMQDPPVGLITMLEDKLGASLS